MPYDKPGTAQVKFKEQSKSQGTEEQHRTHKPHSILDGKIKKKIKILQFFQISTGSPKALILHNSLKIQKRPLYE